MTRADVTRTYWTNLVWESPYCQLTSIPARDGGLLLGTSRSQPIQAPRACGDADIWWLNAAIQMALYDVSHWYDDVEFVVASRQCVSFGNFEWSRYSLRFQEMPRQLEFFESRLEEAGRDRKHEK
ncbi:hypothetical protein EDB87DRAFT_788667 [Lactarius vividus]|nr:hypothetical protein EDB87DRAFT_788667 [Lactarius vividus]